MKTAHILNFGVRQPRRNLPPAIARKRGESNFVSAFAKAYISSVCSLGVGGSEFAVSGFGIADFVWMAWDHSPGGESGTALSIERMASELAQRKLVAFEMKLKDWRKGFAQIYRYSYFADIAVLVLPPDLAKLASVELKLFKSAGVGLWSFDKASRKIRKLFTPPNSKPRNLRAKEMAIELLGRSFKFGKFRK